MRKVARCLSPFLRRAKRLPVGPQEKGTGTVPPRFLGHFGRLGARSQSPFPASICSLSKELHMRSHSSVSLAAILSAVVDAGADIESPRPRPAQRFSARGQSGAQQICPGFFEDLNKRPFLGRVFRPTALWGSELRDEFIVL